MTTILKLEQGTPEWLAHRMRYRNASETPAVLGVSPFMTPYQLWQVRTGRKAQDVTPAMRHGANLEPAARAAYEQLTGNVMEPLVLVDGEYSASLDGMTLCGGLILEVKCPVKGRASELWKQVAAGALPEHYAWQVQHQLLVSKAELAHLWVFEGTEGLLLEVKPDASSWPRIHGGWDEFNRFIAEDTPPPLTERDTVERTDSAWHEAAAAYLAAKRRADEADEALSHAKEALVALTSHSSEAGCGVTVSRYWKAGSVAYTKIPELRGVDLEQYRGPPRLETRVSVSG
jgi:putative phage-type endonuclease